MTPEISETDVQTIREALEYHIKVLSTSKTARSLGHGSEQLAKEKQDKIRISTEALHTLKTGIPVLTILDTKKESILDALQDLRRSYDQTRMNYSAQPGQKANLTALNKKIAEIDQAIQKVNAFPS